MHALPDIAAPCLPHSGGMTWLRKLPLVAAAAMIVVSCSGGDSSGGAADSIPTETTPVGSTEPVPSSTDAAPPTSAVSETTEPSAGPSTTETPASTAAPEPVDDHGACLIGSWIVSEEQMNAYYEGLMTTVDAPITLVATGQATLTFDGATYAWAPDFELDVTVVDQPGTGTTSGSVTGSWSASDGVIVTVSDVNAVELEITVNGTTFSGSDLANGLLNESPVNGVTYSCAGATPVIDFRTADPAVSVPVTLTPA